MLARHLLRAVAGERGYAAPQTLELIEEVDRRIEGQFDGARFDRARVTCQDLTLVEDVARLFG